MLFISLGLLAGCSSTPLAGTAEQRDLGQVILTSGLEFSLSPGTIVTNTESSVEARAAIPLPRLTLSTGPRGASALDITVDNVLAAAVLRVRRITALTSRDMAGCPDQAAAATIVCDSPDADPLCQAPAFERDDVTPTQIHVQLNQQGCRRISYGIDLTDADAHSALQFAVFGKSSTLDQLKSALSAAAAHDPDFVVLLGDDAENSSLNGLRKLDFVLRRSGLAAVVLPGDGEIVEGSRRQFLQTFGPLDFRWDVKGVQMVAFYSANKALGANGISRLRSTLSRLDPSLPLLTFTHTPPLDPMGPRDDGFESELEGARTLSTLADQGVDALFVGHINDATTETINDVKMYLTSVQRANEYLWVRVDNGKVSVEHRGL